MNLIPSSRVKRLHFVGIGGAGMSGIAEVLFENGFVVTGSDTGDGPSIEYLKELGIPIFPSHEAKNVENADLLVYSSAVQMDNPEIVEAKSRRIPVIRRAEMLGELMRLKYTLAVSGTHGKTTTTSMLGSIWEAAGEDPTVIVGGVVKGKGSGAKVGRGRYLIAESDEFDRSFLSMMPSSAIITNIDREHLDTYGTLDAIKDAFVAFANKVPFYGQVVVCIDNPNIQSVLTRFTKPVVTYGFSRQAMYRAENVRVEQGVSHFDVLKNNQLLGEFSIRIPGKHNVLNATATIALSHEENIPLEIVRRALSEFTGVKRRFEWIGEAAGVMVYDDYAHHPTETAATLQGARDTFPDKRIVVVFQPHLYTRTRDQYETFAEVFANCDELLTLEIYKAREKPIPGISGKLIVDSAIARGHQNAKFVETKENALAVLTQDVRPGDLVLFMGAGDIWKMERPFLEALKK
ncbi:UDP-N-acetylmuramate--L-alanine ligase [Fibrobacter intestinalis]|uniref:UDP-N-acetylmuramate--L-alanine ligase n=2 Tax=Fibrobacter TaxID=832 RepID=A0A1M6X6G9_9BACT|nr:UDP-N-acetylmuramate--L-alanine ligase [Fibrobacter intestinalis]MDD7299519.1 UDP-N-acetylmuramate--L-alanine ligase [Fibrobacter intestinalis]SHL01587.1 UDP-N-acetylmuramate--L-alanine ligase [Fibrobacter intestinalis]